MFVCIFITWSVCKDERNSSAHKRLWEWCHLSWQVWGVMNLAEKKKSSFLSLIFTVTAKMLCVVSYFSVVSDPGALGYCELSTFENFFYLLRGGVYCCFLVFFLIVCFLFSLIFIKRFQSFFIFACLVSVSWYSSSQEPSYIRGSWVQVSHQMHTSPPCLLTCEHFGRRQNFKSKSCNSWIRLLSKVLPDFLEKKLLQVANTY